MRVQLVKNFAPQSTECEGECSTWFSKFYDQSRRCQRDASDHRVEWQIDLEQCYFVWVMSSLPRSWQGSGSGCFRQWSEDLSFYRRLCFWPVKSIDLEKREVLAPDVIQDSSLLTATLFRLEWLVCEWIQCAGDRVFLFSWKSVKIYESIG